MTRLGRAVLAAAVAAATGLLSAPAATAAANQPSENASVSVGAGPAANALGYWTKERMDRAKPVRENPGAARGGGTDSSPGAESKPDKPGPKADVPPVAGALGGAGEPTEMAAGGVSRPYTDLPDRLNVKIFFTKATGGNFVCSGTVVNSSSKRMVSTAGHCVSDGYGRYHRNVVVVPAYSSSYRGHEPYGRWTARSLTTRTEWHNNRNFKQDLGYIITNDRNGQRIVNQLGGQGSAFNASRNQFWRSYGYPADYPFNGYDQYVCPSSRLGDDNPNFWAPGPNTIRISCNMTGGSSGGGWLINMSGGLGYVNGLNSYKYGNDPNSMYGPYFGNEAKSLFDFTTGLG